MNSTASYHVHRTSALAVFTLILVGSALLYLGLIHYLIKIDAMNAPGMIVVAVASAMIAVLIYAWVRVMKEIWNWRLPDA